MNHIVDVVIPSYKPGEKLRRCLTMLSKQTLPPEYIFIINTEKKYFDPSLTADFANVSITHIKKQDFDHGATRNLGVRKSQAEFVLLMTDDAVPKDTKLIETMVKTFETDEKIAAVYGRQLPTSESAEDERYARQFNYPAKSFVKSMADKERLQIKTYFQSNVCCMYRRAVLEALGGFPTPMIFNEDMVFCHTMLAAGYKSAYCAEAAVYHAHNYSGIQQLRRNFDLGVSQAEHPEVFSDVKAVGEGMRMVKGNAKQLLKHGRIFSVVRLFYRSGCKFLGYRLGKSYRKLPMQLVLRITTNRGYWRNRK